MTKILIIGATFSKNQGSSAMITSTIKVLKSIIPNAEFVVLSSFPETDSQCCNIDNVTVAGYDGGGAKKLLSRFSLATISNILDSNILLDDRLLQLFVDSDLVLDLSGDGFSDDSGIVNTILSCYDILLCKLLKRPFIIYAQSIGPFKSKFTQYLAKFSIDQVSLLIVRDPITNDYLHKIGVSNRIYLTADSAFLLEAESDRRISEIFTIEDINLDKRPMVGISASQHLYDQDRENTYVSLMAKIVDHLIEKLNAQIIFVPHVTNDDRTVDDRFVARKITELVTNKHDIILINRAYSSEELKGIIGKCDLFIGARMHANIAATSMYVPTLAIAYSHKTYGIMEMLGLEYYVLDFKTMDIDKLISKVDNLWSEKEFIKRNLRLNVKLLKEKALYNSVLVKELIESLDKSQ